MLTLRYNVALTDTKADTGLGERCLIACLYGIAEIQADASEQRVH